MIIGNGVAGVWALSAHRVEALRTRALWWFIGLVEVSVFVQAVLGVAVVNKYKIEFPKFHAFYGFVGKTILPISLFSAGLFCKA